MWFSVRAVKLTLCWITVMETLHCAHFIIQIHALYTNTETHPSPGIRSHCPVIPAIRLLWTIMTPLGLPVEPLVYITTARSEGWGFTISLPTAGQTNSYCLPLYVRDISTWNLTKKAQPKVSHRNTHYFEAARPALVRPACCGWRVLLGNLLCSPSSGPHRSHVSVLGSVVAHSGQKETTAFVSKRDAHSHDIPL